MRLLILLFAVTTAALLPSGIARADEAICRELEACCTGLYEEMQAAGIPVPAVNQCDFAYLVERTSPPASSCQELLLNYMAFAYNLHQSGAIMALPPACSYLGPFTIEPGPDDPAETDEWTIEPGPEEPDWTIESGPEEPEWTIEPGPEEPDWSIEPGPEEPDWSIEPGPADPAEPEFEMEYHP